MYINIILIVHLLFKFIKLRLKKLEDEKKLVKKEIKKL